MPSNVGVTVCQNTKSCHNQKLVARSLLHAAWGILEGSSRKCSDFAKLPSLFVFTLLSTQTSRLKNSQDATVTEMRAKSERTAARLRAETQAFVTEKVRTYGHDCFRPDRDRGVCGTECSPSPAKFSPSLRRGRSLSPTPRQSKQKKEVGRQRGGLKRRKHSKQDCGEEVENEIGFGLNRVQPRRLVGHHFVFVFTLFLFLAGSRLGLGSSFICPLVGNFLLADGGSVGYLMSISEQGPLCFTRDKALTSVRADENMPLLRLNAEYFCHPKCTRTRRTSRLPKLRWR